MLLRCPHCFNRVASMADGTCPSCTKNVNDSSGCNPALTLVTLRLGDLLPAICARCALPTDRVTRVAVAIAGASGGSAPGAGTYALANLAGVLSAVFTGWLFFLYPKGGRSGGGSGVTMSSDSIDVPYCEACSAEAPAEVRRGDPEAGTVQIVAHERFQDEMRRIRR